MMPIKRKTVVDRGWDYNRAIAGETEERVQATRAIVPVLRKESSESPEPEYEQGSFVEKSGKSGTSDASKHNDVTQYDRGMGEEEPYISDSTFEPDDTGVYGRLTELAQGNVFPDWIPELIDLGAELAGEVGEVLEYMGEFSVADLDAVVDQAAEAKIADLSDTEVRALCIDYLRSMAWDTINDLTG